MRGGARGDSPKNQELAGFICPPSPATRNRIRRGLREEGKRKKKGKEEEKRRDQRRRGALNAALLRFTGEKPVASQRGKEASKARGDFASREALLLLHTARLRGEKRSGVEERTVTVTVQCCCWTCSLSRWGLMWWRDPVLTSLSSMDSSLYTREFTALNISQQPVRKTSSSLTN